MKTLYVLFFFFLITSNLAGQDKPADSNFNLDFENVNQNMPVGWSNFGSPNYKISLDSNTKKSGRVAASIAFVEHEPNFKAWSFRLPENYAGKKITLSGYIKTENVTEGYAGLWMRIDPQIAFDNMDGRGATGTTDWTKYEVELPMDSENTEQILVGGLLVGKGKMWIDDLKVSIDGKDIKGLKAFQKQSSLPADNDHEFDKSSQISSISVGKSDVENLKELGMIWGFLKYYHPKIAEGAFNWDYELFRILPRFLATKNEEERDTLLTDWIVSLGTFSTKKEDKEVENVKMEADLGWIKNSGFSEKLEQVLLKVKDAKRDNNHYYIGFYNGVNNPEFKNERKYFEMTYPDAGFRLLALYRYWNIIQYYFPYKNLIEEDWKDVLTEFIPQVINAADATEYTRTLQKLIARIHDTHANIWGSNSVLNKFMGGRYAPVELKFIEDQAVVAGYYDELLGKDTGLITGDVITQINNSPVSQIVERMLPYTPASNYPTQLRDIARNLLRTNDSVIEVAYKRDGTIKNARLHTYTQYEVDIYSSYKVADTSFKKINDNIAYIDNGAIKGDELPKIWKEIKGTKGLIIDNRNYPSDFVIYNLSNYLMPKSTDFVKFTNTSIDHPGRFTFSKPLSVGKNNKNYYKGKVVILVNAISQSSSEFHAMAYRVNPDATVVGSTTAGADGNVSKFYLPGGISTMISGLGVYDPDGAETQRVGIVPDVVVNPTINGVRQGEDEVLHKAIEIIAGKSQPDKN